VAVCIDVSLLVQIIDVPTFIEISLSTNLNPEIFIFSKENIGVGVGVGIGVGVGDGVEVGSGIGVDVGSGTGVDGMVAELNTNSSLFEHEKININIIASIFFIVCDY